MKAPSFRRYRRAPSVPLLLMAALLLAPGMAFAESEAMVKSIQAPVWIESNGQRRPLRPGMRLNDRDQISTGSGARVLIRLSDVCEVRLGENTQFNLDRILEDSEDGKTTGAILNVPKGDFHFTIEPGGEGEENNLRIMASNIAASFNGADIWGRSGLDSDQLCLLDGEITVDAGPDRHFVMGTPMTCFESPRTGDASPVARMEQAALEKESAAATQLQQGKGVQSLSGGWQINLMTSEDSQRLLPLQQRLAEAGYAAVTQDINSDLVPIHRLILDGFNQREDAVSLGDRIKGRYGIKGVWISQSPRPEKKAGKQGSSATAGN